MPRRAAMQDGALRLEAIEGFGDGAEGAKVRVVIGDCKADLLPEEARRLADRLVKLADAFGPTPLVVPAGTDLAGKPGGVLMIDAPVPATPGDDYAIGADHEASFWFTHPSEREEMETKINEVFAEAAKRHGVVFGPVQFDDLGPGETTALGATVPEIPAGMPSGTRLLHGHTRITAKAG